ncbi:MAG: hypothetical protein LBS71_01920 [Puniceicoccales bacterium]|jgi:hypothetical protein|nr:hypothetical protein [Puniceicoccales bacterium]
MKIKTITDDVWNELYVKPFISIGFHEYQSKIIAMAIDDEGICALKVIDDNHHARQKFFTEICSRYEGSPIAVACTRTKIFLRNLFSEQSGKCTTLKIVLKGSEQKIKTWESEVKKMLLHKEKLKISKDNPIQCLDL